MTAPPPSLHSVAIFVTDLPRAVEFYRDTLELPSGPATESRDSLFDYMSRLRRIVSRLKDRAARMGERTESSPNSGSQLLSLV